MKSSLPNAITLARMAAVPVLAALALADARHAFNALLLAALASDLLDGWLARRWRVATAFGARLDSLADILLMAVMLFALWVLHPIVFAEHGKPIYAVLGLLGLGHAYALLRYGHLASFHTWLLRGGIALFSLFAVVTFLWGFTPPLYYLALACCALGALEQLAMIALLPQWRPDIRGGLLEVLRQRARDQARPP